MAHKAGPGRQTSSAGLCDYGIYASTFEGVACRRHKVASKEGAGGEVLRHTSGRIPHRCAATLQNKGAFLLAHGWQVLVREQRRAVDGSLGRKEIIRASNDPLLAGAASG